MILGFKLEPGSPDVIVFDVGGRRPATAPESVLWAALQAALANQPAPTGPHEHHCCCIDPAYCTLERDTSEPAPQGAPCGAQLAKGYSKPLECDEDAGHTGDHSAQGVTWPQGAPPSRLYELAVRMGEPPVSLLAGSPQGAPRLLCDGCGCSKARCGDLPTQTKCCPDCRHVVSAGRWAILLDAVRSSLADCNCPCCRGNLVLSAGELVK